MTSSVWLISLVKLVCIDTNHPIRHTLGILKQDINQQFSTCVFNIQSCVYANERLSLIVYKQTQSNAELQDAMENLNEWWCNDMLRFEIIYIWKILSIDATTWLK